MKYLALLLMVTGLAQAEDRNPYLPNTNMNYLEYSCELFQGDQKILGSGNIQVFDRAYFDRKDTNGYAEKAAFRVQSPSVGNYSITATPEPHQIMPFDFKRVNIMLTYFGKPAGRDTFSASTDVQFSVGDQTLRISLSGSEVPEHVVLRCDKISEKYQPKEKN